MSKCAFFALAISYVTLVSCGGGAGSGGLNGVNILPTPQIVLRTTSATVGPAAGTTGAAIVTSESGGAPVAWTASTTTSWIHLTDTSGATASLGSVARFTYDANPGATRTGVIQYQSLGYSGTLTVTQAGVGYVASLPAAKSLITLPMLSSFAVDLGGNVYFVPNSWSDTSGPLQEWVAATTNTKTLTFPASSECPRGLSLATGLYVNEAGTIVADRPGQCPALAPLPEVVSLTLQWTEGNAQSLTVGGGAQYWAAATPDFKGNNFAVVSAQGAFGPSSATTSIYADGVSGLAQTAIRTIPSYFGTGFTGDTNGGLYVTGYSTANVNVYDYSILRIDSLSGSASVVADLASTITNNLAMDGSGNFYFLVQDLAAANPSTYLDYYLAQWSPASGSVTRLSETGAVAEIYGDGVGNIYAETPGRDIEEFTPVFVNTKMVVEPAGGGSDELPAVVPNTTEFTAVSDSPWLTVTGQSGGVVSFSFTATGASRVGHIAILGQSITVSQEGPVAAVRVGASKDK